MRFGRITCSLALTMSLPLTAAEVVDRIVAVVGEEIITASDVREALNGGPTSQKKDPLLNLIHEKLMTQEMENLAITISDGEIADGVQSVLNQNGMSLEALKAELEKKGVSFTQYKNDLAQTIRRMKFIGRVIVPRIRLTEEEINGKAGKGASEEQKLVARQALLEARIPAEIDSYLEELRKRSYVEIR